MSRVVVTMSSDNAPDITQQYFMNNETSQDEHAKNMTQKPHMLAAFLRYNDNELRTYNTMDLFNLFNGWIHDLFNCTTLGPYAWSIRKVLQYSTL